MDGQRRSISKAISAAALALGFGLKPHSSRAERKAPMNLNERLRLKFRVSQFGVAYDIPVGYLYHDFAAIGVWPLPPADQLEGRSRRAVDVITLTALLPDLAPYSEANADAFNVRGYGQRVRISVGRPAPNWPHFFTVVGPRLQPSQSSESLEGMHSFVDRVTGHDIYLSHVKAVGAMTKIRCTGARKAMFPSCDLFTNYGENASLQLLFGREHLSQWRAIQASAIELLKRLSLSATAK